MHHLFFFDTKKNLQMMIRRYFYNIYTPYIFRKSRLRLPFCLRARRLGLSVPADSPFPFYVEVLPATSRQREGVLLVASARGGIPVMVSVSKGLARLAAAGGRGAYNLGF